MFHSLQYGAQRCTAGLTFFFQRFLLAVVVVAHKKPYTFFYCILENSKMQYVI